MQVANEENARLICSEYKKLEKEKQQRPSLNYLFLKRLFRLFHIVFSIWISWKYFLLLLLVSICTEIAIFHVGTTASRYYNVLNSKDFYAFKNLFFLSLGLFLLASILKSTTHLMGGLFALNFRDILTCHLQTVYMKKPHFYDCNFRKVINDEMNGGSFSMRVDKYSMDSPDQRITDDVPKVAESVRKILETSLLAPIAILYYSFCVYNVAGWFSVAFIFGYFLLTSLLAALVSSRLVAITFLREKSEGHFRYLHLYLRKHAESISMLNGETNELGRLKHALSVVLLNQKNYLHVELFVKIITNFTADFGAILSYLIISIPIFAGKYNDLPEGKFSELISKTSFMSMYLIYKLTNITELFTLFSDLAGYTIRVSQLLELEVEDADLNRTQDLHHCTSLALEVESFAFRINQRLLTIPTISIPYSTFTIIQGISGSGKTSLLRVIAGLWRPETVSNFHISKTHCPVFLPQLSYLLPNATLMEQLAYPHSPEVLNKREVDELISYLNMGNLHLGKIERDSEFQRDPKDTDWTGFLSPGEQQKLCFARAILQNSRFLIVDEATCFMDAQSEEKCIGLCLRNNITLVWAVHENRTKYRPDKIICIDQ